MIGSPGAESVLHVLAGECAGCGRPAVAKFLVVEWGSGGNAFCSAICLRNVIAGRIRRDMENYRAGIDALGKIGKPRRKPARRAKRA